MTGENLAVYDVKKSRENQQYSPDPSSSKRLRLFFRTVGIIMALLVVSMIYLRQLSLLNQYRTDIARSDLQKKELETDINNLQVIVAELSSLDRIKRIAEDDMNMVKSAEVMYIEVPGIE